MALNNDQKKAIGAITGPLHIIAGPGTGKTTTIIERTVHMLDQGIKPENILMCTYTEKAAREMISRLSIKLDDKLKECSQEEKGKYSISRMRIGTIHSICMRILMDNLHLVPGLHRNFTMLEGQGQEDAIALCMEDKTNLSNYYDAFPLESEEEKQKKKEKRELEEAKKKAKAKAEAEAKKKKAGETEPEAEEETPSLQIGQASACFWVPSHADDPKNLAELLNRLTEEEYYRPEKLKTLLKNKDLVLRGVGQVYQQYLEYLQENNCLDFSMILAKTLDLLNADDHLCSKLQDEIQYIVVDEYQDTNPIQEKVLFKLAEKHRNICVVGDDDQSLYRFRGATVDLFVTFPTRVRKYFGVKCTQINLKTNYRSNKTIIDSYFNDWMPAEFWNDATRQSKKLEAGPEAPKYNAVFAIPHKKETRAKKEKKEKADEAHKRWMQQIQTAILSLRDKGGVPLHKIAVLCNSVKNDKVVKLIKYLEDEKNGKDRIQVHSPRSNLFFDRPEVRMSIGCLLRLFPNYIKEITEPEYPYADNNYTLYLLDCIAFSEQEQDEQLQTWLKDTAEIHKTLSEEESVPYGMTGLYGMLMGQNWFKDKLQEEMKGKSAYEVRGMRNLGQFCKLVGDFDDRKKLFALSGAKNPKGTPWIDAMAHTFFSTFLRNRLSSGLGEYEDDMEQTPEKCVSFMTVHQAKGLEFPVVFSIVPSKPNNAQQMSPAAQAVHDLLAHSRKGSGEDPELYDDYDFKRQYYTAFSRPMYLLIVTPQANGIHPDLKDYYEGLPEFTDSVIPKVREDIHEFLEKEKEDGEKKTLRKYSYTGDVALYRTSPQEYKFYRELGFRNGVTNEVPLLTGTLVHNTLEDIHRYIQDQRERGKKDATIQKGIKENLESWYAQNLEFLGDERQRKIITNPNQKSGVSDYEKYLRKLQEYVASLTDLSVIEAAEKEILLTRRPEGWKDPSGYIVNGKIDLIQKTKDGHTIVDFKTGTKVDETTLKSYANQLRVYAGLYEAVEGKGAVTGLELYFPGIDANPTKKIPFTEPDIAKCLEEFDATVRRIATRDYDSPKAIREAKDFTASIMYTYYQACNGATPKVPVKILLDKGLKSRPHAKSQATKRPKGKRKM